MAYKLADRLRGSAWPITFQGRMRSKLSSESSPFPSRALGWVIAAATGLAGFAWSATSAAHFTLISPASWVEEDSFGNPQKLAPCGGDTVETTGAVSTYRAGSTVTVRWQETVGHPGHFRISLADDRADLVDPHVVTTTGDGMTGQSISADIMNPLKYPVLVDGAFPREGTVAAQVEPFSIDVQLPDRTCESCTLQIIQFMANHDPGYFYHHCADLRIVDKNAELPPEPVLPPRNTSGTGGSGTTTIGDAGSSDGGDAGGGCSLTTASRRPSAPGFWVALGLGAALWRRRAA